ncbi:MAG: excisionase family DNA-binding protein [Deltaproteobacteria bacterium]|nr:excisionase family DNA-binding protein [Deltaproteobacteria bacterium]
MQKTIFTLSEAAELLSCHKNTLRKAILEGALRAARLGRDYRVSRLELQKFWMEMGGGELFGGEEAMEAVCEASQEKKEESQKHIRGRSKKSQGDGQLTLPLG